MAESAIGFYKAEAIGHEGPWKGLERVDSASLELVHWLNHTRLLEAIRYVPPVELEKAYYADAAAAEEAERLRQESLH